MQVRNNVEKCVEKYVENECIFHTIHFSTPKNVNNER